MNQLEILRFFLLLGIGCNIALTLLLARKERLLKLLIARHTKGMEQGDCRINLMMPESMPDELKNQIADRITMFGRALIMKVASEQMVQEMEEVVKE